ncbi:hypothetical protein EJB05_08801, partial [Eragrostis curvula]
MALGIKTRLAAGRARHGWRRRGSVRGGDGGELGSGAVLNGDGVSAQIRRGDGASAQIRRLGFWCCGLLHGGGSTRRRAAQARVGPTWQRRSGPDQIGDGLHCYHGRLSGDDGGCTIAASMCNSQERLLCSSVLEVKHQDDDDGVAFPTPMLPPWRKDLGCGNKFLILVSLELEMGGKLRL